MSLRFLQTSRPTVKIHDYRLYRFPKLNTFRIRGRILFWEQPAVGTGQIVLSEKVP